MKIRFWAIVFTILAVSNVYAEMIIMDQERSVTIAYPGCDWHNPLPDKSIAATDFEPWLVNITTTGESCGNPDVLMDKVIGQNSTMSPASLFAAGRSKQETEAGFWLNSPTEAISVYRVTFIVSESTVFEVSGTVDLLVQNQSFPVDFETGLEIKVTVDKTGVGNVYSKHVEVPDWTYQHAQVSEEISHVGLLTPGIYDYIIESRNAITGWDEWDEMVSLELSYVLTLDFSTNSSGNCDGDFDGDGDVDLRDYAVFQSLFTGPLDQ